MDVVAALPNLSSVDLPRIELLDHYDMASIYMPQSQPNRWIKKPQPRSGVSIRLFCLPFAGGNSSAYWSWPDKLPSNIELCLVELPGRQARLHEAAPNRISSLIEAMSDALAPELGSNYALYGHSYGALLAFELARRLRHIGAPAPNHVFVSGFRAPHLNASEPAIHRLRGGDFIEELQQRYGAINKTVRFDEDLLMLLEPTLRADMAACETYHFQPDAPLHCPITALWAHDDATVCHDDVAAWHALTTGSFVLHEFSGGHFFIHSQRDQILAIFAAALVEKA